MVMVYIAVVCVCVWEREKKMPPANRKNQGVQFFFAKVILIAFVGVSLNPCRVSLA